MNDETMREPQYRVCLQVRDYQGLARFGLMSNQVWHEDPKRLTFLLARYKFVGKMLSGLPRVLEVGCADAFGTRLVRQEVAQVTAVDFDPVFIRDAQQHLDDRWSIDLRVHDILEGPVPGPFDGAYSLDVIEHIPAVQEGRFVANLTRSLTERGVLIIGTPSLHSQAYASTPSREGHVNCKTAPDLKRLLAGFFHNVFIFSMNDEVVHTGFYPMAHYLIALCCAQRDPREWPPDLQ
jgi:2-polyprenyl-3-methyl-5-hydroxy-6-metoxy-1,4-benzoquinol methylase